MVSLVDVKKKVTFIALEVLFMMVLMSNLAWPESLSESQLVTLARVCAPSTPDDILSAVAHTESNLDPLVIHDDTTGRVTYPEDLKSAVTVAIGLISHGDSVDLGLMQINSANLPALSMTVPEALDSCKSLAGGAAILQSAFGAGGAPDDQKVALLMALSRYNTGTPFRGIMNGYARAVISVLDNNGKSIHVKKSIVELSSVVYHPSCWDISATGDYARAHGAPWLIPLAPGADNSRNSSKVAGVFVMSIGQTAKSASVSASNAGGHHDHS
jgi:type IV secretion system protein VirB1